MKIDITHLKLVAHGVLAAFVSAALTTVAGMVVTPDLSYHQMLHTAVVGGLVGTSGYFIKSPVGK